MRGRPPTTRARVVTYWTKHGPCTIGQVCRATGAERSHVKRILRMAYDRGEIVPPVHWLTLDDINIFSLPVLLPRAQAA